jgi:hypothetical protein
VPRSMGSATTSVIEWKSGDRRISVGLPATGLSSSSASDWANPAPRESEKWPVCTSPNPASQGTSITVARSSSPSARPSSRRPGPSPIRRRGC